MQSYLITGGNSQKQLERIAKLDSINSLNLPPSKLAFPPSHPDIYLIDPAFPSIGIEEVRKIISFSLLKPFSLPIKIIFIEKAQRLTLEAQNALLKLLEEPPPSCIIALSTTSSTQLLPTVISRCQLIEIESQITLHPEELKIIQQVLNSLINSPLEAALVKGEEISKNRAAAIETCRSLILLLGSMLYKDTHPSPPPPQTAKLNRHLESSITHLNANISPRLVIDQLILKLRSVGLNHLF